ncbi:YerC/YecD family TrpR-related protein [Patescibacteria group bacterium]
MPKLNPKPVEKRKMDAYFADFFEAISLIESSREAKGFFFDLLTHTERKMIAKRFQVALMLLGGFSYRTIRTQLKVGDGVISKINNWLNTGADDLIKIAKRLEREEGKLIIREKRQRGKKHAPGDLLTPLIEDGLNIAAKTISQRGRRGIKSG